jgi:hypothetical protein
LTPGVVDTFAAVLAIETIMPLGETSLHLGHLLPLTDDLAKGDVTEQQIAD